MIDPITKLMASRSLLIVAAVVVGIEAVFMVESFTTILETTLNLGGSVMNAVKLVLLKSPEVIAFGIPIALLVGVYFAVTRIREEWALVICAAAGVSWIRLPVFAAGLGLAAAVASVVFSGYIVPQTRYLQRLAIFDMRAQNIIDQLGHAAPVKTIQQIAGTTIISLPARNSPQKKPGSLFVYYPNQAGNWHVSLIEGWALKAAPTNGRYIVKLRNFRDYSGRLKPYGIDLGGPGPGSGTGTGPALTPATPREKQPEFSVILVKNATTTLDLRDILGTKNDTRRLNEMPLARLLRQATTANPDPALRLLAQHLGRAILGPFAALAALLAAAAANGAGGRLTALPLAALGLLTLDMVSRPMLVWAAVGGLMALSAGALALFAISLLPMVFLLSRYGETIILPYRDKTG